MGKHQAQLVVVLVIFLTLQPIAISATSSKVYVFSWDIMIEGIQSQYIPRRIGFHFDQGTGESVLVSPVNQISGKSVELIWFDDAGAGSSDIQYDMVNLLLPYKVQFFGSVYRSNTRTVYMIMDRFNLPGASGLVSVQKLSDGSYLVDPNAIPPPFTTQSIDVIGFAYHVSADQLLLLGDHNEVGITFIYDYKEDQWVQLETPSPRDELRGGVLTIAAPKNQAIYYNSVESTADGENLTYIFDFKTAQWSSSASHQVPTDLVGYEIIYNSEIEQYFLLGGRNVYTDDPNSDIWIFDPDKLVWVEIFKGFPILSVSEYPKSYYDPLVDTFVIFTTEQQFSETGNIVSLHADVILEGFEIDIGIPIDTFLMWLYVTLGVGVLLALTYILTKRKSIFTGI